MTTEPSMVLIRAEGRSVCLEVYMAEHDEWLVSYLVLPQALLLQTELGRAIEEVSRVASE